MLEVVTSVATRDLPLKQLSLVIKITAYDLETDEEVEILYIKFRFR